VALLCAACEPQQPRSFEYFMDDAIARDGALAHCNRDRDAALTDIECSNARRAAAAVAAANESARSSDLALEFERKLQARRDRDALQQQAELRAAAEAQAAAQAAYDATWLDPNAGQPGSDHLQSGLDAAVSSDDARVFGPPIGAPVTAESSDPLDYDFYAEYDGQIPLVPNLELAAVTPPQNDLQITRPELSLDEAAIPRPFRNSANGSEPASQ
jgi:hypothetical protein